MPNPSDPVDASAERDHASITALLDSDSWKEQLRVARVKREKVLAERARLGEGLKDAGKTDQTPTVGAQPAQPVRLPRFLNASAAARSDHAVVSDTLIAKAPSVPAMPPVSMEALRAPLSSSLLPARPSRAVSLRIPFVLGIGLAAGLALGLGLPPLAQLIRSGGASASAPSPVSLNDGRIALVPDAPASTQSPPVTSHSTALNVAPAVSDLGRPQVLSGSPAQSSADISAPSVKTLVPGFSDTILSATGPLSRPPSFAPDQTVGDFPSLEPPEQVQLLDFAPAQTADLMEGLFDGMGPKSLETQPRLQPGNQQRFMLGRLAPDDPPVAAKSVIVPVQAGATKLTVHLGLNDANAVQAQLQEAGLANARMVSGRFGPSRTLVVYYRAADAEIAGQIAAMYHGETIEMAGFRPTPPVGRLDLYLSD